MGWGSAEQMDHSDPAQKGRFTFHRCCHSASLPVHRCTDSPFRTVNLSLWFPISLQVSVPRDLAEWGPWHLRRQSTVIRMQGLEGATHVLPLGSVSEAVTVT